MGWVAVLLLTLLVVPPVLAAPSVRVISQSQSYDFSERLDFALAAESDVPIVEVVLFFGEEGERLVRRIYPGFVPGVQVQVDHREQLESGQYAPGIRFRVWWQLLAQDGTSFKTDTVLLDYTDDNQEWKVLSGARTDLFWYADAEAMAESLSDTGDEAIARLETDIGVSVEERISIYVYNSSRDMAVALSQRSQGYDDRVMTLGVAVGEHTLLLLGTHRDAELTIAHELSHLVIGLATDNPYTDLPRWLDEGLAMYAEGKLPSGNRVALDQAVKEDALLSIRSMTSYSGRAEQIDLFYGEAYSVIEFLLDEYGRDSMRELLAVFSEGTRQEEALQRVYGFGLDDLDTRWRASLGLSPRSSIADTPTAVSQTETRAEGKQPLCGSAGLLAAPFLAILFGSTRRPERAR